jgi:hypothetical protein
MTNQKLKGKLADKGWLVFPKCNRLTAFDGTVLHGVVPGRSCPALLAAERSGSRKSSAAKASSSASNTAKGSSSSSRSKSCSSGDTDTSTAAAAAAPRRITFMCAFWKDIQARPTADGSPGASQLFPEHNDTRYRWQQPLIPKRSSAEWSTSSSISSSNSSSSSSGKKASSGASSTVKFSSNNSSSGSNSNNSSSNNSSSSSSSNSRSNSSSIVSEPVTVYPHRLNSVWDVVDSSDKSAVPVRKLKGVPNYELCFQGF